MYDVMQSINIVERNSISVARSFGKLMLGAQMPHKQAVRK